jgi:hypothetical protein
MFLPLRGRAVAARRAHNPEASGSNPLPATIFQTTSNGRFWFKHAFNPPYEVVGQVFNFVSKLHSQVPILFFRLEQDYHPRVSNAIYQY